MDKTLFELPTADEIRQLERLPDTWVKAKTSYGGWVWLRPLPPPVDTKLNESFIRAIAKNIVEDQRKKTEDGQYVYSEEECVLAILQLCQQLDKTNTPPTGNHREKHTIANGKE